MMLKLQGELAEMTRPIGCAYCCGTVSMGYADGKPCLMHSLPHCEAFENVEDTDDAVSFMQRARLCSSAIGVRPGSA